MGGKSDAAGHPETRRGGESFRRAPVLGRLTALRFRLASGLASGRPLARSAAHRPPQSPTAYPAKWIVVEAMVRGRWAATLAIGPSSAFVTGSMFQTESGPLSMSD